MNTSSSIQALRRANPRAKAGFADSVAATAETLHARIAATGHATPLAGGRRIGVEHPLHAELVDEHPEPRAPERVLRRLRRLAAGGELRVDRVDLGCRPALEAQPDVVAILHRNPVPRV